MALQLAPLVDLSSQLQDSFTQQDSRLQMATHRVQAAEQRIKQLQHEVHQLGDAVVAKERAHQDAAAGIAHLRARLDHISRSNQLTADSEKHQIAVRAEERHSYVRTLRNQTMGVYSGFQELKAAKHPAFLEDLIRLMNDQEEAITRLHTELHHDDEAQRILEEATSVVCANRQFLDLLHRPLVPTDSELDV